MSHGPDRCRTCRHWAASTDPSTPGTCVEPDNAHPPGTTGEEEWCLAHEPRLPRPALRRVNLVGTASPVPYAAYDAVTGELVGYADDPEDGRGVAYLTLDAGAVTLAEPEPVAVAERDESAWE